MNSPPHTFILSSGRRTGGISGKFPLSSSLGLDSFFFEEVPTSYEEKLVGISSPDLNKRFSKSVSYSVTGWEVDVPKALMLKAMDGLKLVLVGKFLAYRSNIKQGHL